MSPKESEKDTGHGAIMSGFFWIKRKNKCPITDILSWASMVSNVKIYNVK